MSKKIAVSFLFAFFFLFVSQAQAALLTCGGDKTEADCTAAGGTVVNTGGCTSCSIAGSTCPSGMTQYSSWTYYTSKSCGSTTEVCKTGVSPCSTKCVTPDRCTTSSSSWLNSATAPTCEYSAVDEYEEGYPSCSLCSSSYCPSGAYKRTCVNQVSAGCAIATYTGYFIGLEANNCYSTKSNVACIGSGTAPTNALPIGYHEAISCSNGTISLRGWAYDPDASSTSIDVHFYEGSTIKGGCTANIYRQDVNDAKGITGNHVFQCDITGMSAGTHNISVYAINTPAGTNPLIQNTPLLTTCATVTVPTPTLTASCNSSGLVSASWTAVSGADYYALRIDTDTALPHLYLSDVLTTTSKTWQGTVGTSYNVWVHAIDNGVWSGLDMKTVTCSTVTPYSCTNQPTNATVCSGDGTGLTANTNSTLVSSCVTNTTKCEYTCNGGYHLSGGTCVADVVVTCDCQNSSYCGGYGSALYNGYCDADAYVGWMVSGCEWITCTMPYECTGTKPAGTIAWDSEENDDLTQDVAWLYSSSDTSRKCELTCQTGYVRIGGVCVAGPTLSLYISDPLNSGVTDPTRNTRLDDFIIGSSAEFTYAVSGTSTYPVTSCEASVSSANGGNWTGSKNYGDGTYSYSGITPLTTGFYTYYLTCYNSARAYTTDSVSIRVNTPPPPNTLPTAIIKKPTENDTYQTSNTSNRFEGTGTDTDAGSSIIAYRWFINNSEACSALDPMLYTAESTKARTDYISLSNNATYNVCLRVQDNVGAWSAPDYLALTIGTSSCSGIAETERSLLVTGSTSETVYGTGTYTTDSDIPTAAVHAGLIENGEIETINIAPAGCINSFTGSDQNGVTSLSWGSPWYGMTLSENTSPPTYHCIDPVCSLPENCGRSVPQICVVDSTGEPADPQTSCSSPACEIVNCASCPTNPPTGGGGGGGWEEVTP